MKFAFSTNAFRKFPLENALEAVSGAGYDGVEIMCDTPHAWPGHLTDRDIIDLKAMIVRHRLGISNLNAFMMCEIQDFHHPSWIEPDKSFRQLRVEYTLKCIDLAAALGARTVSTEPGGPVDGMSRNEAIGVFIQGLSQVLPLAREKGIFLLIEPEPDLLIQTSDEFLDFINQFNHPNLGLNFDVGHFYCVGEDPVAAIDKLKPFTRHYHLEDIPETREHLHILPGEGGIDIRAVLRAIDQTGYRDYVTIELYPYLDRPEQAAMEARTYLKKVWGHG